MPALPRCLYRRVDVDGAILCDRIKQGDREISPDLCRACPVAAIDCSLLRATLSLHSRPPIRVRYGNGKTDLWAGEDPTLTLNQAACSTQVIPITSPRDCSDCHLRQSLSQAGTAVTRSRVAPTPVYHASPADPAVSRARPIIPLAPYLRKTRPVERAAAPVNAALLSQRSPLTKNTPAGPTDRSDPKGSRKMASVSRRVCNGDNP